MSNTRNKALAAYSVAAALNITAFILIIIKSESSHPEFDGQDRLPILIPSALIVGSALHLTATFGLSYAPSQNLEIAPRTKTHNNFTCLDCITIPEFFAGILFATYARNPGMYNASYWPEGLLGLALTNVRTIALISTLISAAAHLMKTISMSCTEGTRSHSSYDDTITAPLVVSSGFSTLHRCAHST